MSFVRESFKYCFKNFFSLLVFILPVSVLMGFLNPYRTITFLGDYSHTRIVTFWDMMQGVGAIKWQYLVTLLITVVLLILTISLVLSSMEYHMRTGKFSFSQAFKRMNYFFFPVLSLAIIFVVFFVFIMFLMPAINYFIHFMLSGLGNLPTKTTLFLCSCVYIIGYLILFMFLALLLVAVNLIALNGYNVKSALSNSLSLLEGKFFKFFSILLIPYILIIPIVLLTSHLSIYPLLCVILFILQFSLGLSLCMISYFSFTNTKRKDNPTGYFIKGAK